MMAEEIEVSVGDVTDVEARVYARYRGASEVTAPIKISGRLRGPFCDRARTLVADFDFQPVKSDDGPESALAVVTDPCMWTEEMPHFYQVDVEARQGGQVVAEYHGKIGFRRLAPRRPVDFAPGTG
jgi:hypothetical protein